jgi:hypothetical protein
MSKTQAHSGFEYKNSGWWSYNARALTATVLLWVRVRWSRCRLCVASRVTRLATRVSRLASLFSLLASLLSRLSTLSSLWSLVSSLVSSRHFSLSLLLYFAAQMCMAISFPLFCFHSKSWCRMQVAHHTVSSLHVTRHVDAYAAWLAITNTTSHETSKGPEKLWYLRGYKDCDLPFSRGALTNLRDFCWCGAWLRRIEVARRADAATCASCDVLAAFQMACSTVLSVASRGDRRCTITLGALGPPQQHSCCCPHTPTCALCELVLWRSVVPAVAQRLIRAVHGSVVQAL